MVDYRVNGVGVGGWCVVVDKPAGLLVHRTSLDAHEDLNALELLQAQLGERLWPLHRLDKATSGVLLFARSAEAARHWGQAFQEGRIATLDVAHGIRNKHHNIEHGARGPDVGRTTRNLAPLFQHVDHGLRCPLHRGSGRSWCRDFSD